MIRIISSLLLVIITATTAHAGLFSGAVSSVKSAGGSISNTTKATGGKVAAATKSTGGSISNKAKSTGTKISNKAKSTGGIVSDKMKATGTKVSNYVKPAGTGITMNSVRKGMAQPITGVGKGISSGVNHLANTPVRLGQPNGQYIRGALNHRPFANNKGTLGRNLGGWSNQDFGVYAATSYAGGMVGDAVIPQAGESGLIVVVNGVSRLGVSSASSSAMQKVYWQGKKHW